MEFDQVARAITANARWFNARQDEDGFIRVPADEYYGIPGDASLIGHSVSVRIYAWRLTGDESFLVTARRSLEWLASRQDERGGWRNDAGFALDAAQCVTEGLCTHERLTGDARFHETLVRAADRMIEGTITSAGDLRIGNIIECGEYAHFSFLAWKQTGLERHKEGGQAIVRAIEANFDEQEGYWNTAIEPEMSPLMAAGRPILNPVVRACAARLDLKGKTVARIVGDMLPLVIKGKGPQYALGFMDAESLLDQEKGRLEFPELRRQTARAIEWAERSCRGPAAGSLTESKRVPAGEEVYPVRVINDTENASLFPTSAYLMALVGMNDPLTYGDRAQETANWILAMQDNDGGFLTHEAPDGRRYGQKYGNINFYATSALWSYGTRVLQPDTGLDAPF